MQQHSILLGGLELEVDVSAVAEVEGGQRDGRVRDAERYRVVEQVWNGTIFLHLPQK